MTGPGKTLIVGLGGVSCSGKTTLARLAAAELTDLNPVVVCLDCYYNDLGSLALDQREKVDFDDPRSLDWPLLLGQVDALAAGLSVERPVYDYGAHTRKSRTETLRPGGLIMLEGVFALDGRLIPRLDLAVFLETPLEEAYRRRLARDVVDRGRKPDYVAWQWEQTVIPGFNRHIAPARDLADLVLDSGAPVDHNLAALVGVIRMKAGL